MPINLKNRLMVHAPLSHRPQPDCDVFAIPGQAVRETLDSFMARGGDTEELLQLLNGHTPAGHQVLSLADLRDVGKHWTHEFAFYLSCFCKDLLGDPLFCYGQGGGERLSRHHKIYEQGPMRREPWGPRADGGEVRDFALLTAKAYLLYLDEHRPGACAEFLEWLNRLLPPGYACLPEFLDGKLVWCSLEFMHYCYELFKVLVNNAAALTRATALTVFQEQGSAQFLVGISRHFVKGILREIHNRCTDTESLQVLEFGRDRLVLRIEWSNAKVADRIGPYAAGTWDNCRLSWAGAVQGLFVLRDRNLAETCVDCAVLDEPGMDGAVIRVRRLPPLQRQRSAWRAVAAGVAAAGLAVAAGWALAAVALAPLPTVLAAGNLAFAALGIFYYWQYKRKSARLRQQGMAAVRQLQSLEHATSELLNVRSMLEFTVRQRTAALAGANAELTETERRRSVFLANISHELKTPLALISAPIQEIRAGGYGASVPADHPALATVERNVARIQKLVSTMLQILDHHEHGQDLVLPPLDLRRAARAMVADFASLARTKLLYLSIADEAGLEPVLAACTPEIFDSIGQNLLSNAIKYTREGGRIEVELSTDGDMAVFRVSDTGIGIPRERMPELFQRFHRALGQDRDHFEGQGLGLALANEMAKSIGGSIDAESVAGAGSVFTCRLPLAAADEVALALAERPAPGGPRGAPEPPAPALPAGEAPTVLLVDDNQDLLDFLSGALAPELRVLCARDGLEALALLESGAEEVQAIVCDVMMPQLDGIGLLARVQAEPEWRRIPVLFLTARNQENERVAALGQGALDWINKPFSVEELRCKLRSLVRLRAAMPVGAPAAETDAMAAVELNLREYLLGERDCEVARLVCQGLADKEIARQLKVANQTVSNRLSSLYRRIGVNSRAALVAKLHNPPR